MVNKKRKAQRGQSTIEFLSTLSFVLAIIFFYIKMALNLTNGYLMHYATFMASRAYLVQDNGGENPESVARDRAKQVFGTIKENAMGIEQGGSLSFNSNISDGETRKVFVGVWTSFKQKFSYSTIVGGTSLMTYISESFLGREPGMAECARRVCEMMNESGLLGASCDRPGFTVVDNGC